jgi:membrane associated rhomboid family serine protease
MGYPRWTPAVKTIIIACAIVFILQFLVPSITEILALTPVLVTHSFFVWQLATYIFLHDTGYILHIVFNMLGLWMFGSDLERYWGTRRFVQYFFICGIGAGLMTVLFSWNSPVSTIGASGAIYGVLLAFGVLFPDRIIYFVIFPIPAKWFVVIMGVIAFWSSLGSGTGVAHIAHLGGMLFGFLYLRGGRLIPDVKVRYDAWQRNRLRKKFDVYYNERHRKDDPSNRWKN